MWFQNPLTPRGETACLDDLNDHTSPRTSSHDHDHNSGSRLVYEHCCVFVKCLRRNLLLVCLLQCAKLGALPEVQYGLTNARGRCAGRVHNVVVSPSVPWRPAITRIPRVTVAPLHNDSICGSNIHRHHLSRSHAWMTLTLNHAAHAVTAMATIPAPGACMTTAAFSWHVQHGSFLFVFCCCL